MAGAHAYAQLHMRTILGTRRVVRPAAFAVTGSYSNSTAQRRPSHGILTRLFLRTLWRVITHQAPFMFDSVRLDKMGLVDKTCKIM